MYQKQLIIEAHVSEFTQALSCSDWRKITQLFCDNIEDMEICREFYKNFHCARPELERRFFNKKDPYVICAFLFTYSFEAVREKSLWFHVFTSLVHKKQANLPLFGFILLNSPAEFSLFTSLAAFMGLCNSTKKYCNPYFINCMQQLAPYLEKANMANFYINPEYKKHLTMAASQQLVTPEFSNVFFQEEDLDNPSAYSSIVGTPPTTNSPEILLDRFRQLCKPRQMTFDQNELCRALAIFWLKYKMAVNFNPLQDDFNFPAINNALLGMSLDSNLTNVLPQILDIKSIADMETKINHGPVFSEQFVLAGCYKFSFFKDLLRRIIQPMKMILVETDYGCIAISMSLDRSKIAIYNTCSLKEVVIEYASWYAADGDNLIKQLFMDLYWELFKNIPKDVTIAYKHCHWPLALAIYGFGENIYSNMFSIEFLLKNSICNATVQTMREKNLPANYHAVTSALHFAALLNSRKLVEYFLQAGACPNSLALNGMSALEVVAKIGSDVGIVWLLLSYGANFNNSKQFSCLTISNPRAFDIYRVLLNYTNVNVQKHLSPALIEICILTEVYNSTKAHPTSNLLGGGKKPCLDYEKKNLWTSIQQVTLSLIKELCLRGESPDQIFQFFIKKIVNKSEEINKIQDCARIFYDAIICLVNLPQQGFSPEEEIYIQRLLNAAVKTDYIFARELFISVITELYFRYKIIATDLISKEELISKDRIIFIKSIIRKFFFEFYGQEVNLCWPKSFNALDKLCVKFELN
jgi:hypothetical protein